MVYRISRSSRNETRSADRHTLCEREKRLTDTCALGSQTFTRRVVEPSEARTFSLSSRTRSAVISSTASWRCISRIIVSRISASCTIEMNLNSSSSL